MIELRAMGAIDVIAPDNGELTAVLTQPKRLALLIYLSIARPRGYHRRDTLIALLWPELDASHSRNALSKAIHHLRRSLGDDAIVARGDEVMIEPSIVRSDVRMFEDALATRDHRRALDVYRGPLADGFFVSDAPAFERWLDAERERLRGEASRAAWTLAENAKKSNRSSEAAALARTAASFVPQDEPVLRRLMSFLESVGDRAGALRAYDEFASWLRDDLDAYPAPETQAVHRRIRENVNAFAAEEIVPPLSRPAQPASQSPPSTRKQFTWVRIATIASAVTAAALLAIGLSGSKPPVAPYDAKRVMVARFENRTGNSKYDAIGAMAMDWISQDVVASGLVSVVDPRSNSLASAGLVVSGAYYIEGGRFLFHGQLSNSSDKTIARAFAPVSAPLESPTQAFDSVGHQAVGSIAEATDARVAALSRTGNHPPSYESYLEYVKGIDAFGRHDEKGSYQHFMRAYELDTTFVTALLNAGASLLNRWGGSDSVMRTLTARRASLTPFNQRWLDSYLAARNENWVDVFRITEDLARQAPGSYFPYIHAAAAVGINNPRAARDALLTVDPTRGWMHDWFDYWYLRCGAQHMLGDYNAELSDARIGRRQYPANFAVISAEVRPLATMGRALEVDALLDAASSVPDHQTWDVASPYAIAAAEAAAHGHPEIAQSARQRVVKWYRSLPPEKLKTEPWLFGPAWVLFNAGAWPELAERAKEMRKTSPADPLTTIYEGLVAAHAGDRERALAADSAIQELAKPHRPGEPWLSIGMALFDRAEIAALLGDRDHAIDLLREGFSSKLRYTIYVHASPAFASLRTDPRFIRIMAPRG